MLGLNPPRTQVVYFGPQKRKVDSLSTEVVLRFSAAGHATESKTEWQVSSELGISLPCQVHV